jgi:hypothetical protein
VVAVVRPVAAAVAAAVRRAAAGDRATQRINQNRIQTKQSSE